jgi:hypothetical protein
VLIAVSDSVSHVSVKQQIFMSLLSRDSQSKITLFRNEWILSKAMDNDGDDLSSIHFRWLGADMLRHETLQIARVGA